MKTKKVKTGKLIMLLVVFICLGVLVAAGGSLKESFRHDVNQHKTALERYVEIGLENTEQAGGSRVYFTPDISSQGVLAVYRALGVPVSGKVAIKLHMGEPGNQNYLRPELLRDLVDTVKGSFVDSNTAYGGRRGTTEAHLQAAKNTAIPMRPLIYLTQAGN